MKNALLRRLAALIGAVMMCFALTVPALADETLLSGSASLLGSCQLRGDSEWYLLTGLDSISSGSSSVSFSLMGTSVNENYKVGWKRLSLSSSLFPSGAETGVYFSSYYLSHSTAFTQSKAPSISDFFLLVNDSASGGVSSLPVKSVSLFSPSSSAASVSDGVTISARFSNSVSNPYSSVALVNGSTSTNALSWFCTPVSSSAYFDKYYPLYLFVTSFRVVSTASNAELDALESMADAITAQNEILSAYYGDIVEICNQIYQRLGDMQAAQEEANALFSQIISLLNTTNGKLSAINQAMSTYFELLINQLKQEGVDTRTAIADAEARLELYLKPMIDYFIELEEQTGESASTLPQHKTDIDGFDNQGYGIDGDGQAGLSALVPIFGSVPWLFQIIAIFIGVGIINLLVKKGLS